MPETIAYVPVPVSVLPDALRAIADLVAGGSDVAAAPPEAGEMGPNGVGWDAARLSRLTQQKATSVTLICQVLDALAETPDRRVPTSEITSVLGVSRDVLRASLGSFTRHLKKHHHGLGWPMTMVWGPHMGDGHLDESYYAVDAEVAREWQRARAGDA